MSKYPKLALVGRPNVGKSALFNCICKKRIAIVDEMEGVTRDRLYANTDLFGLPFQAIDTGGIDPRSKVLFNEEVKRQAEIAIEEADTIVMVVDSKVGITQLDEEVSLVLKKTTKPLCLAVNKVDDFQKESVIFDFLGLGITKKIAVSATQNWHIAELLEAALEEVSSDEDPEENQSVKLAIIGRPNVGKSSLVNAFLEEERCIVSPHAGTTRDSVDILFRDGEFTLIDTAGIKRKGSEKDVVEKFSSIRTHEAIKRADVCLLMLDAEQGMTTQEKRIATQIEEAGKGCLILFNKWDLVKGYRMEHCMQAIENQVPFLKHCPKLFISAIKKRNLDKILPHVGTICSHAHKRIGTHELNTFIEKCIQRTHPPMIDGKRLRIYYMAQVEVHPPRFVLFVNHPKLLTATYKKYLVNQFRKEYSFAGIPLRFFVKRKCQDLCK